MAILKRGLSDIVTNVLIILLVLVAIGIIWLFVRPFIQAGAGGVTGADACLTVSVEPVSCVLDNTGTPTIDGTVTVRRNAGAGDVIGIGVQLTNPTNQASSTFLGSGVAELNTMSVGSLPTVAGFKVKAFTVVKTGAQNWQNRTCPISLAEITC